MACGWVDRFTLGYLLDSRRNRTEADVAAGPVELSADSGEIEGHVRDGHGRARERDGARPDEAAADGARADDDAELDDDEL